MKTLEAIEKEENSFETVEKEEKEEKEKKEEKEVVKAPKLMRKPTISYWIKQMEDLLDDEKSYMASEETAIDFDAELAKGPSKELLLSSLSQSDTILDVKQLEEMQQLYKQLEDLRQEVKNQEER